MKLYAITMMIAAPKLKMDEMRLAWRLVKGRGWLRAVMRWSGCPLTRCRMALFITLTNVGPPCTKVVLCSTEYVHTASLPPRVAGWSG